ncbi:MAG: sugar ABC transporter permease [Actinobacteria bacterium]|nr:MAG: sugar ABC transporter permease [Actinomycetota bacterium]
MTSTPLGRARRGERGLAVAMISPTVIVMVLVAGFPILYAIWLSLHEYSVQTPGLSRWAEPFGLGNYLSALTSADFWAALRTTLVFTVVSVFLELMLGMIMALIMNAFARGKAFLRAVVLVPWSVLTVVTAIMWRSIFDPTLGFVNTVLGALGLPDDTVWLGQSPQALIVMIVADVWKTAPFMALLLLAGLQGIPKETYEAAAVDGSNAWQTFWRITLPLLRPAILVALIFRTLEALRIFDLPFVLTKGAYGTNTLSLLSYQELQQNGIIGLGSALAVITFIVVMAVSVVYIRLMRPGQEAGR